MGDSKACRYCGLEKPASEFYLRSDKPVPMSWCKTCHRDRANARRRANPNTWRARNYRNTFGITLGQYDAMLTEQRGLCAGCRLPDPSKRRLAVDHDHRTGKVRGLLCGHCNRALGLLRDDPRNLRRLARYVEAAA